ncbi:hypothetical protein EYA88_23285 [Burkholderia pseudomallei]|uniref:immunity 52 family protein n=1 Tax=Burkholderia pseudomallei TaxID=28450 RepID=UPI001053A3D0|nr:immunity 52 family protein [Burkholderia pseudomallei]QBL87300.1 hypothetical protein EYA88_23285 [Burkholderia pseudomallei]
MNITASVRDASLVAFDFPEILTRISKIIDALKAHDDSLRYENWMLKGDNQEDATRYHVYEKQVFDDKPGVGWMLYLPKVITQQQVPEARALIPVPAKGKQTGTIIVSVTDAPFSVDNPEHVAIANRIEIRLVDQDLLPAYVDI